MTESGVILYALERKDVKHLNLRVKPDGVVCVSAHPFVSLGEVDAFVRSKAAFIRRAQASWAAMEKTPHIPMDCASGETVRLFGERRILEVAEGKPRGLELRTGAVLVHLPADLGREGRIRAYRKALDALFWERLSAIAGELAPRFHALGAHPGEIRIRTMRARWGSCRVDKREITLNRRLVAVPEACTAYVLCHEFCHLLHPDHGAGFYALLDAQMPDWKARDALLRREFCRVPVPKPHGVCRETKF